jgi:iron(III) transport system substrate-binding protein
LFDFLASRPAQEILVSKFFRRPIRQDIDTTKVAGLPPISAIKVQPIDDARAIAAQPAFLAMWKELMANPK